MRTAFILAGLATTLVALNPQAENENKSNSPDSTSLHVPQRASSPMMRADDSNSNSQPADSGTDTTAHVDNSGSRPEMVMDSKDTSSNNDKPSSGAKQDTDKHSPASKPSTEEDDSLPGLLHKYLPGIGDVLFPESSSSSIATPTPTMESAAEASAKGELFHFHNGPAESQPQAQAGGKQRRAVAPQPAAAATGEANAMVDTVLYRTVTRTETSCACASSAHGVLATATATETATDSVVAVPVHSSNAVVATPAGQGQTERVEAMMPSGADPMAAVPTTTATAASTPVHAVLTEENINAPSPASATLHGVQTELTSGSVRVHGVSTPAIRSATRVVVASATPTAGVSHSAFVGEVAPSSSAAVPSGVDPLRNGGKDEQLFTGAAAFTGPREMVVMGVTGFLAVMMLL